MINVYPFLHLLIQRKVDFYWKKLKRLFPEEKMIYPLIEYPADWKGLNPIAFLTFVKYPEKEKEIPIIFFRKTIRRGQISRVVKHEMVHLVEKSHSFRFKEIFDKLDGKIKVK